MLPAMTRTLCNCTALSMAVLALATAAAQAAPAADAVTVADPGIRAVAPGTPVGAAYMRLVNDDDEPHALVAVRSEAAASVEIHDHTMSDGMMRMRRLDQVVVPAGGEIAFEPGGTHLMLIGLERGLDAGDTAVIELEFGDGSRVQAVFPVR